MLLALTVRCTIAYTTNAARRRDNEWHRSSRASDGDEYQVPLRRQSPAWTSWRREREVRQHAWDTHRNQRRVTVRP